MGGYKLIYVRPGWSEGWTLGKVYKVNREGRLIDDDGDERLRAKDYARARILTLVPVPVYLENK